MSTRAWKILGWLAASIVLAGVFALYTRPSIMVTLGDMIWSCFH